jgi:hypothetical protein
MGGIGPLHLIAGTSQQGEQLLLQRFQEPADGGGIALELASTPVRLVLIELVQRVDQLVDGVFDAALFLQRHERTRQRATDVVFALALWEAIRKRLDEAISRLERIDLRI